jgi:hypothetical protein
MGYWQMVPGGHSGLGTPPPPSNALAEVNPAAKTSTERTNKIRFFM